MPGRSWRTSPCFAAPPTVSFLSAGRALPGLGRCPLTYLQDGSVARSAARRPKCSCGPHRSRTTRWRGGTNDRPSFDSISLKATCQTCSRERVIEGGILSRNFPPDAGIHAHALNQFGKRVKLAPAMRPGRRSNWWCHPRPALHFACLGVGLVFTVMNLGSVSAEAGSSRGRIGVSFGDAFTLADAQKKSKKVDGMSAVLGLMVQRARVWASVAEGSVAQRSPRREGNGDALGCRVRGRQRFLLRASDNRGSPRPRYLFGERG